MQDHTRKKVKTHAQPGILGLDLDEHNTNKLHAVVNAILDYRLHCQLLIEHQENSIRTVPEDALKLLPELTARPQQMAQCFNENQFFLKQLIEMQEVKKIVPENYPPYSLSELETLLLDVAREWAAECALERNYIHTVRQLLRKHLPNCEEVLVPNFRTGRLLAELLLDGLAVRGHEESFAHFLAGSFFLNRCIARLPIYPYICSFCNHLQAEGPYQKLMVPELIPQNEIESQNLTASVGDFVRLYRFQPPSYDCVISCFYLENTKNCILMVRLFRQLLRPKGLWINYGTLSYHRAEFELTQEELLRVARHQSFTVIEQGTEINRHHYNKQRMLNTETKCCWFVARKDG